MGSGLADLNWSRPVFKIDSTLLRVGLCNFTAKVLAASSRAWPYCRSRDKSPRHALYPCSGWGLLFSRCSTTAQVLAPIDAPQLMSRVGVHSACARWALGICCGNVVCTPRW
jgi:hypothetical protein